jgi:hypothetical protein
MRCLTQKPIERGSMDSAISDVGVTTEIRNQHGHQHQLECRDLVGSRRITNHSSHGLERSWPFERMRSNSSINQGSSTGAQTEPKRGAVPQHRSAVDLQREDRFSGAFARCSFLTLTGRRSISPLSRPIAMEADSAVADSQNTRGDPVEDELLRAMDLLADGRPGSL